MSDIATRVKKIIVDKLGVDEAEVTNEASFTNDLGADSLDTVELIMEFEKEFNISIPDEQAETITTVGQAVSYLEEHAKRSEEHTSELQSQFHLVCRLLLEKKKFDTVAYEAARINRQTGGMQDKLE